jgi:hypothetical protein
MKETQKKDALEVEKAPITLHAAELGILPGLVENFEEEVVNAARIG